MPDFKVTKNFLSDETLKRNLYFIKLTGSMFYLGLRLVRMTQTESHIRIVTDHTELIFPVKTLI